MAASISLIGSKVNEKLSLNCLLAMVGKGVGDQ